MKYLYLLLLLLPLSCFAQLKIEGKVINAADGKPISDASVFINNATIGTKADNEGTFTLYKLNTGQYELIVSVIGYETYHQTILVNNNMVLPDIKMLPKTMMMKEVRIGNDPKWKRKLKEFKEQFLGLTHMAYETKLLNPEVLNLHYNKDEKILTATTDEFLEIDNNGLGYKVKYLLASFTLDKQAGKVSYQGWVLFEEKIPKSELEKVRWNKNRYVTYRNSPAFFLREVLADRVDSNFVVRRNHILAGDELKTLKSNTQFDTLQVANYIHPTENKGVYAMGSNYKLAVDLFMARNNPMLQNMPYASRNGITIATIEFTEPYLYFDSNGSILNPLGAIFGNSWGYNRVAHLLPVDYWPSASE